ncbi:minor capsid protein [Ornithinimicrobium cerasi]|uniref:minor capsid protein n=1 Tax=Ornithinimicrobium cerasi TaxID=2248773 RepID=UPI000F009404|nr:minor capsid protein [Ornithinimicrobium cerasi]
MATTTDLLVGFATLLHDAGVGHWAPTGVFPPGATAITTKVMPHAPARAIVLTAYTVSDTPEGHSVQGLQVRTRADGLPTDVDDLDDAIYQVLHSAQSLTLPGLGDSPPMGEGTPLGEGTTLAAVKVKKIWRQSHASLGRDDNDRWLATANYYLLIDKPTPHTR